MAEQIERDHQRFKKIVRGQVRKNLRKYITHGEMFGRKGKETVSIPVPSIDLPRFMHGSRGSGGVGSGDGQVGQPVGKGGQDQGSGPGTAGDQPGAHVREVEMSLDELAEMLGEELELPNIEPKGKEEVVSKKDRYNSVRQTGPDSLRHFKRTYKEALKRQIASGEYNPRRPVIVPTKEDERYRSWTEVTEPQANAAIIYIMDVSGSMTDEQKEIVRTEAFWIDAWLQKQYDGTQRRYIIHDALAKEVDEDTFYRTRESGGTRISSAYNVAASIIEREFPPDEWNIYIFQFSDGDNWGEDNRKCLNLMVEKLIPACNLFCYGQVDSPYGSGDYLREMLIVSSMFENIILSEIESKAAIYESIKTFLGTGR